MMRGFGFVCLLAAIGVPVAAGRQQQPFQAATHTVSVYATVVEEDGRLITDLTRGDFEVYDNGVRQTLSVFANDLQPITIVAMLDRSGSVRQRFGDVRDAAEVFIRTLLPDDRVRIGSFSERIEIYPETFTNDRAELLGILDHRLQDSGPTPLWNATAAAMDALAAEDGRRVVLVFTDGRNTPGNETNIRFEEVRDRSRAEDVMVYAIGLAIDRCGAVFAPQGPAMPGGIAYQADVAFQFPGRRRPGWPGPLGPPIGPRPGLPPVSPQPPREPVPEPRGSLPSPATPCGRTEPDPQLQELAAVGGGGYFELDRMEDLRGTFARVADELHHQYLLAFPAAVLDDTVHTIEVRVRRPGATVRARHSYLATARPE